MIHSSPAHDLVTAGRGEVVLSGLRRTSSPEDVVFEDVDVVLDALFWDGDPVQARAALPRRAANACSVTTGAAGDLHLWLSCVPAMWFLVRGDTAAALAPLERSRSLRSASSSAGREASDLACVLAGEALLEYARSTLNRAALDRLDSLLTQGFEQVQFGNLVAARLHEARGDPRSPLAVVRRRSNHDRDGPGELSTMLREEGRLAALTGDRAGAIRAYRHFLVLRPDPIPRLVADQARVQRALAQLEAAER